MITLTDGEAVGIEDKADYQLYLAEQSPPVLPCSRASLTAFMTVAYLSAMCILKMLRIYYMATNIPEKKREIRLPVVLLVVVCTSQVGREPGPTGWPHSW